MKIEILYLFRRLCVSKGKKWTLDMEIKWNDVKN